MTLGEKLQALRMETGLSREDLAEEPILEESNFSMNRE